MREIRIPKALTLLFIVYMVVFGSYSVLKCLTFRIQAYDTGIYMQSLWTAAEGKLFYNTPEAQGLGWELPSSSHFGVHFQPILFFLIPIYKLFPYPETLLLLETLAMAIAIFPLYALAYEILNDERKSLLISLLYLMNPAIHGINRYDFHPVAFAIPPIFLLMYYWVKGEYKKGFLISILVLLVKEDAGLILISLGIAFTLQNIANVNFLGIIKRNIKNINLMLLGMLWITLSVFVIIPFFGKHSYSYHFYSLQVHFPNLALWMITINLMAFAFLPLLKPKLLLATLPLWLELILSPMYGMVKIGYHYPYMLVPMLALISIYALKEVNISSKIILGISLSSMVLFSPLINLSNSPDVAGARYHQLVKDYIENKEKYKCLLQEIQKYKDFKGKLVVQDRIFPYLASNENVYLLRGVNIEDSDIILFYPGFQDLYSKYYAPIIRDLNKAIFLCSNS
ncbi:DUF2079 domain-containing protein [Pyrococcus horikoshii]|uniref:DUF2079 domain-containing protein n=2 Tax=Pyrococcus horikoshii TaxID=53953 RepID=O58892_PYRHO|nr:DUF2079 domain-containing protein [Pyrococcus horikoshii]BAA30242.1 453aa long hypothetical protein [Pyrococcus horikoshii OT3]HII61818.1 DUF2079 domain-containing protein [Pyrococcus horikoshii]